MKLPRGNFHVAHTRFCVEKFTHVRSFRLFSHFMLQLIRRLVPKEPAQADAEAVQVKFPKLSLSLIPERNVYDVGDTVDMLVSVHAHETEMSDGGNEEEKRPGIDIVAVVDTSGSMRCGKKIEYARLTLQYIIDSLGSKDRLAIVQFDRSAHVVMSLTNLGMKEKGEAKEITKSLQATGSATNIYDGLDRAFRTLSSARANSVCGVLLLTDGLHNVGGKVTIDTIKDLVRENELSAEDMLIHTIAFGADHDIKLLKEIAEHTKATYSFVEKSELISDAIAPALAGMLSVVAKKSEVQITCANSMEVFSAETGAYLHRISPKSPRVTIQSGDFYSGEVRNFLVSMKIKSAFPWLVECQLVYSDAVTDEKCTFEFNEKLDSYLEPGQELVMNPKVSEFKIELLFKNGLKEALAMVEANKAAEGVEKLKQVLQDVTNYPHPVSEDFKTGLLEDIRTNLERIERLAHQKSMNTPVARTSIAALSSAAAELNVQRSGLNSAMSSTMRFTSTRQATASREATPYFSKSMQ
jgi:Mg-chelatase subunit ChlD